MILICILAQTLTVTPTTCPHVDNCHLTLLLQVRSAGEDAWLGGPAPVDPLLDPIPKSSLLLQQQQTQPSETISATGLDLTAYVPTAGRDALCHNICNMCTHGNVFAT